MFLFLTCVRVYLASLMRCGLSIDVYQRDPTAAEERAVKLAEVVMPRGVVTAVVVKVGLLAAVAVT